MIMVIYRPYCFRNFSQKQYIYNLNSLFLKIYINNKMEDFYLIDPSDRLDWVILSPFNHNLLEHAWEKSPHSTIRLLFYLRCRGGKGSRWQFYQGIKWFMKNHPEQILVNLNLIPEFGYWRDLLYIWDLGGQLLRAYIVYIFCQQLKNDYKILGVGDISLAAKWAPTEHCAEDRRRGFVDIFCDQLKWTRREYRQRISKLRDALEITERLASDRRWGEIDFQKVPAKSRAVLHKTLQKYCGKRYTRWCVLSNNAELTGVKLLNSPSLQKILDGEKYSKIRRINFSPK